MLALNLSALLVFVVALVMTVLLLRRYVWRGEAIADPVCLICGAPAALTEAFICSNCQYDVRNVGLLAPRSLTAPARLGRAILFSICFLLFAGLISAMILSGVWVNTELGHRSLGFGPGFAGVTDVILSYDDPRWNREGFYREGFYGRIVGDLITVEGQVTSIAVQGNPPRAEIRSADGVVLVKSTGLNEQLTARWFEAAGVDVSQTAAKDLIERTHLDIESIMFRSDRRERGAPFSPRGVGRTSMGHYTSRSGPIWWVPGTLLISWSILWVLGMRWTLRQAPFVPWNRGRGA